MEKTYLSLLILILLLGCIRPPEEEEEERGPGLQIREFLVEEGALVPNERTRALLRIENLGDHEAREINVILMNYGEILLPEAEDSLGDPSNFSLERGSRLIEWKLLAPPKGYVERRYNIIARVYYFYQTIGYQDLVFVPAGVSPISTPESGSTLSPLGISITSDYPIELVGEANFSVEVRIENVGKGYISYYKEMERENMLEKVLIIAPKEWTMLSRDWNCRLVGEKKECEPTKEIRVARGEEVTLFLKFRRSEIKVETKERIRIELSYGYAIDSSPIQVILRKAV
jgi:hypothetical protein